ncbi:MAG: sugar kinase [Christensenellaceae bacterium]|jgi:2-dehydro-3-deoxygluconokinase|nr:sugar kinase [Christensenellaceae bacterium]
MQLLERSPNSFDLLGFGEVMLRLTPPDKERLAVSESFEKTAGGSELNVMCGAAALGLRTGIITSLPDNPIGQFVKNRIRFAGVSDDHLLLSNAPNARLGVYYYEMGAHPRKSSVVYDRADSAFTQMRIGDIPGDPFQNCRAFLVSGITLALGETPQKTALELIEGFHQKGARIAFDVNYRAALWSEEKALKAIKKLLPKVDFLFVSEETSRRMMGRKGSPEEIARGYHEEFGCSLIAMTMRQVLSPTRHGWDSMIYDADAKAVYREAPYTDIEVVDRIGSGDAYLSGVLGAYLQGMGCEKALKTGNAMAAVKNTVMGDMPVSDWREINSIIAGHEGQLQSEMNR